MRNLVYHHNGKTYTQVSKAKARKAYNAGQAVALVPSNLYGPAYGVGFCVISQSDIEGEVTDNDRLEEFNARALNFAWYNCIDRETGRYPNYFLISDN